LPCRLGLLTVADRANPRKILRTADLISIPLSGSERMPTVLLVDDESAVRRALRKIFEHGGLTVREAESGRGALDAIAMDQDIAAVVSDFLMPEINGLDFYDALVAVAPHLKHRVVFLTGAARDPMVHNPLEQRGVPLINKLEDLSIVLDAVKLALLRKK
jgi:CheY-like chemotaxis protein